MRTVSERYPHRDVIALADGREVALPTFWGGGRFAELDAARQRFIVKSVTSFHFFFHNVYLPFQSELERQPYPEVLPEHWSDLCVKLDYSLPPELVPFTQERRPDGIYQLAYYLPTGTGKSTLAAKAFPAWLIGIDNDTALLLGTSTKTLGEKHVENVKKHITENPLYAFCFGRLHHPASAAPWSGEKICVDSKRDLGNGNIEVFGYRGHVEGGRFDVGVTDDVVDEENSHTDPARLRVYNWMAGQFRTRLHAERRLWMDIGTIHNARDAHARTIDDAKVKGNWDVTVRSMVADDEPGCPWPPELRDPELGYTMDNIVDDPRLDDYLLWKEFWTRQKVYEDYVNERAAFAWSRQNRPRDPADKLFPLELLKAHCRADGGLRPDGSLRPKLSRWDVSIGIPRPGSALYSQLEAAGIEITKRVISVDPAASDPKKGTDPDFTVFELWGYDQVSNARILLDLLRFRTSSPREEIAHLRRWCRAYRPHRLVYEANAMAKKLAVGIEEALGIPVQKRELKAAKTEEIESFRDLGESGLLLYCYAQDGRTIARMSIFEAELNGYPDEAKHDDTLTAAIHAYSELEPGALHGGHVWVFGQAGVEGAATEDTGEATIPADYEILAAMEDDGIPLEDRLRALAAYMEHLQAELLQRLPPTREDDWARVGREARAAAGMPPPLER